MAERPLNRDDIAAAAEELLRRGVQPTHMALAGHFDRPTKAIQRALKREPQQARGRAARGTPKAGPANSRGREAGEARQAPAASSPEPDWIPVPRLAVAPGPPGRLELVYGYDDGSRAPLSDVLGCLLVAGDRGAGKSSALAYLAQQAVQLGALLVLVDAHAPEPESLTRRIGRGPDDAAVSRRAAWDTIARVRALMDSRLVSDPDRSPVVLVVDEYPRVAWPSTPDSRAAVADLVRITQEGRKPGVHLWIGTTSPAGEGSGLPRALRDQFDTRVLLRSNNTSAVYAAGRPLSALPASPPGLTHGRALVLTADRPDYVLARLPLPTADGRPAGAPPELPAIDPRQERRALAHIRGVAIDRIERAVAAVRELPGAEAAALRGALAEALRAAKRAASLGELRDELAPYWPDADRAEEIRAAVDLAAVRVEALRRARPALGPEPDDFEPDQDAEGIPEWTPRPGFSPDGPSLGEIGSRIALHVALGGRWALGARRDRADGPANRPRVVRGPGHVPPGMRITRWSAVDGGWLVEPIPGTR